MKDKAFADLLSVYSDKKQLNLDYLSNIYSDETTLNKMVESIMSRNLNWEVLEGRSIFLKPNWVKEDGSETDNLCLRTNDAFVIAALKAILKHKPSKILIADAPIQGCKWDAMLSDIFTHEIQRLSDEYNTEIRIKDLRRRKLNGLNNKVEESCQPIDDYLIFDLGTDSSLEPITTNKKSFRVTCYNPDKLAESHAPGVHKYCIAKEIFDYDVVITLPKIKTHQKAGLTNSLKILVGINGDKDFLPHHRIGSIKNGGDCYKDHSIFRSLSEMVIDEANRNIGKRSYKPMLHFSSLLWKISKPDQYQNSAAGWYGNDTVWRMVLDLNKIAIYGKKDGTIAAVPQRKLFTLCDGIVAGQGDGPLHPIPLPLGIIGFSNNSYLMDVVAARLFKLHIDKVPLIKAANDTIKDLNFELTINGEQKKMENLNDYAVEPIMPPGWVNYDKL